MFCLLQIKRLSDRDHDYVNSGVAGHIKVAGEKHVTQPRQVSALAHDDVSIRLVTCSDAATVVYTSKGDVFVLHEYQCRKIVSK